MTSQVKTHANERPANVETHMRDSRRPKLEFLQAGRAVASIAVVAHHSVQATDAFISPGIRNNWLSVLHLGYLGVDFFFVLSGFIIYYSIHVSSKRTSLTKYITARANRIYTPYLPIGILMAGLYTLFPMVSQADREWGWFTTLTLLPSEKPTALSVAWTLRHEVLFYGLFGVFIFANRIFWGACLWVLGIVVYATLGNESQAILGLLFNRLNLEFVFGIAVAYLVLKDSQVSGWRPWLAPVVGVCGALLCLGAWVYLGAHRGDSWIVGLSLAFAMLVAVKLERAGKLAINQTLVFLGDASYAIYLIHPIVIAASVRVLRRLTTSDELSLVVMTIFSIAVGCMYHVLFERPALAYVRNFLSRDVRVLRVRHS